jgi:hypothetical protein
MSKLKRMTVYPTKPESTISVNASTSYTRENAKVR